MKASGSLRAVRPRHWLAIGLALALVGLVVGVQLLERPAAPSPATGALHLVEQTTLLALRGDVQLQRVGATSFEAAAGQRPLQVGDRVRTGPDGYAAITYFDGSSTSLEPDTELVLQRFERDPASGATAIIVQQPLGSSWTRAEESGHPFSGFLLASAAGRFFARGSQFATMVAPEGTTSVTAVEGLVFGRAQNGDVEVPTGFATRVYPGEPPEPPLPASLAPFTLQVRVDGPVRALLTDARGRSLGYHPQAEPYVSQIPRARLVSVDGQGQVFTVPGPVEAYDLTLLGRASGEVSVAVGILRAGEQAAPAAALLSGQVAAGEVQTTGFGWQDEQVRELRPLAAAPGPPPSSAVALLRNPPSALAMAPTATPAALAAGEDDEPAGDAVAGRARPAEPDAADVFSSFDAPVGLQRPPVVAPALPNRPAVVTAPAPAPVRPPVVSQPAPAPTRPAVVANAPPSGARSTEEDTPTAVPTRPPPPPTAEVRVVTATPPPPTPVPPTPIPPTRPPPTPVPPTPEPTVPPALPTPVPTAQPARVAAPRSTVAPQRPAIAPTATAIPATAAPASGPTRCPYPSC